jgi:hypothetical protein
MDRTALPKTRRDGWTAERQLRFLDALAQSRNVSRAVAAVGMSREGAYRLRARPDAGLFALLWDRALQPEIEVHTRSLSDGAVMRALGVCYRRKIGTSGVAKPAAATSPET